MTVRCPVEASRAAASNRVDPCLSSPLRGVALAGNTTRCSTQCCITEKTEESAALVPHAQHCTIPPPPSLPNTALHLRTPIFLVAQHSAALMPPSLSRCPTQRCAHAPLIAPHSTALSPPSLPNTGLRFRPPLLPHRALHLEWDAQQRRGAGAGQDLAVRALRPHELSEMMLGHLFVAQDGHSVCDALSYCDTSCDNGPSKC